MSNYINPGLQVLPVLSGSNVLPGEGVDTDYPIMRLSIDIVLGAAQHLTNLIRIEKLEKEERCIKSQHLAQPLYASKHLAGVLALIVTETTIALA